MSGNIDRIVGGEFVKFSNLVIKPTSMLQRGNDPKLMSQNKWPKSSAHHLTHGVWVALAHPAGALPGHQ